MAISITSRFTRKYTLYNDNDHFYWQSFPIFDETLFRIQEQLLLGRTYLARYTGQELKYLDCPRQCNGNADVTIDLSDLYKLQIENDTNRFFFQLTSFYLIELYKKYSTYTNLQYSSICKNS